MPQGSYERSPAFFGMRVGRPGRLSWDDRGVAGDKGNFPIKFIIVLVNANPCKYSSCLLRLQHERGCPKPLLVVMRPVLTTIPLLSWGGD